MQMWWSNFAKYGDPNPRGSGGVEAPYQHRPRGSGDAEEPDQQMAPVWASHGEAKGAMFLETGPRPVHRNYKSKCQHLEGFLLFFKKSDASPFGADQLVLAFGADLLVPPGAPTKTRLEFSIKKF